MPYGSGAVLAPVDVDKRPELAIQWASAVALVSNSDLEIYYAAPHRRDEPLLREELLALTRMAAAHMASAPHLKVRQIFDPTWDPATGICAAAKAGGHKLIVQITRERSGLQRLLQGSTTEDVISEAPCPVLAIPDDLPAPTSPYFKRILAATDLSSSALLCLAAQWADRCQSGLTYLYVVDVARAHLPEVAAAVDPTATFDAIVATARRDVNAMLHASPHLTPQVPFDVEVRVGDSAREIARDVAEGGYDLVMAGHQHRGLLSRLFQGSVAEEVLHRADVPVLVLPLSQERAGQ